MISLPYVRLTMMGVLMSFGEAIRKSEVLNLRSIFPVTNLEKFASCQVAMEMVVDTINSRPDILPDFHVITVFEDTYCDGPTTMNLFFDFVRMLETSPSANSFTAPFIVGPFCEIACRYLASVVHQFNVVELAYGCTSSSLNENRRLYPNFYRTRPADIKSADAIIQFIKHAGNNWVNVGIVTSSADKNDFDSAVEFFSRAQADGLNGSYFDMAAEPFDNDEENKVLISYLKQKHRARILVVWTSTTQIAVNFLCAAYRFGLRGGDYVFIVPLQAFFETDKQILAKLPAYCNRSMLDEQIGSTFWAGSVLSTVTQADDLAHLEQTSLGYNRTTFENRFSQSLTEFLVRHNANITSHYDLTLRLICHDTMLQSLLALDKADRMLRRNSNLTLKYFRDHPEEVMSAINVSLAQSDFVGLRTGRINYLQHLDPGHEDQQILQWVPSLNLKPVVVGRVIKQQRTSQYIKESEPIWFTPGGQPPSDSIREVIRDSSIPEAFDYGISFLSTAIASVQIFLLRTSWRQCNLYPRLQQQECPTSSFILLSGMILIDLSVFPVVLFDFLVHRVNNSAAIASCLSFRALSMIGLGVLISVLFSKMAANYMFARKHNSIQTVKKRNKSSIYREQRSMKRSVTRGTVILSLMNCLLTVVWLACDSLHISVIVTGQEDIISAAQDVIILSRMYICHSGLETFFLIVYFSIFLILLMIGGYFAYSTRNLRNTYARVDDDNIQLVRLAIFNCFSIIVAALFIAAILLIQPKRTMTDVNILFTVSLLIISASTTAIVFKQKIKDILTSTMGSILITTKGPSSAISMISLSRINPLSK